MKIFERYFERNTVPVLPDFRNQPDMIVIIPVIDDPDIFGTLDSLYECTHTVVNVGVIVVVNHGENYGEDIKQANKALTRELRQYARLKQPELPGMDLQIIEAYDLPAKYAGVGLARKIAMDAAALSLYRAGKPQNPIVSLDADTLVERNYLDAVFDFFQSHPVAGISIAYAHRWNECEGEVRQAMIKYELYLRYYLAALKYIGHPYAFHCIGSAFAVRAADYVAQGGMNKRQAGEDFYFLQKLISTGRYATLNTTRVYPSARFSERTPFGTGRSVLQIVERGGVFPTYDFEAFRALKLFFSSIPALYQADEWQIADCFIKQTVGVKQFLIKIDASAMVKEVNVNCASGEQFVKRFFDNFNAFQVLKYLNYVHEELYPKIDISEATEKLFRELHLSYSENLTDDLEILARM